MSSSFMVLDMGLHMPKSALPRSFYFCKFGRHNIEKPLPSRPVESYSTANIFHAYTRDLRLRSLHFDMKEEKEWASSFFTAPGSIESILGQSSPFMVSMRVAADWVWEDRRNSVTESRGANRIQVGYQGKKEETKHTRRRFFHVCITLFTSKCLDSLQLRWSLSLHCLHATSLESSMVVWLSNMSWCISCHPSSSCPNHE